MSNETECKINEHITLKLVNNQTKIFVGGKEFIQCKRLILQIPLSDIPEYDEIESIDEARAKHATLANQRGMGPRARHVTISPMEEFWGHCSNLQAWVEHDYDTRLLHSNLSFPLLKRLVDAGDPLAKDVFNKEIINRIKSGFEPTIRYLNQMGYLKYLTEEEVDMLQEGDFLPFNPLLSKKASLRGKIRKNGWLELPPKQQEPIILDKRALSTILKLKILILGDPVDEKQAFLELNGRQKFSTDYKGAIGTSISLKKMGYEGIEVVLICWDISSAERWTSMRPLYYKGATAAIVCFDIGDPRALEGVNYHLWEFRKFGPPSPEIVVGIQSVNVDKAKEKELESFFEEKGLAYMKVDLRIKDVASKVLERAARSFLSAK